MIGLSATSIWLGQNRSLYDFWFYITNFSRYPMEIYNGRLGHAAAAGLHVHDSGADRRQRAGADHRPARSRRQSRPRAGLAAGHLRPLRHRRQPGRVAVGLSSGAAKLSQRVVVRRASSCLPSHGIDRPGSLRYCRQLACLHCLPNSCSTNYHGRMASPRPRRFDSPQQEVYLNLWRTYDRLRMLEDELFSRHDLTAQQYNALRLLRGRASRRRCRRWCWPARLVSHAPDITRLVDRLEERGLVVRERMPDNRRVVQVGITEAGLALLKELDQPVRECHQKQLGHLSVGRSSSRSSSCSAPAQPHEEDGVRGEVEAHCVCRETSQSLPPSLLLRRRQRHRRLRASPRPRAQDRARSSASPCRRRLVLLECAQAALRRFRPAGHRRRQSNRPHRIRPSSSRRVGRRPAWAAAPPGAIVPISTPFESQPAREGVGKVLGSAATAARPCHTARAAARSAAPYRPEWQSRCPPTRPTGCKSPCSRRSAGRGCRAAARRSCRG